MSDTGLRHLESIVLTSLLAGSALWWLLRHLKRQRPDLAIGNAIAAAVGLRVVAAGAVALTGVASTLRGGDETGFLIDAAKLNAGPLDSNLAFHDLIRNLHTWVFAIQERVLSSPTFALRITQIAISVAGIVLVSVAVHDLAGPRAGRIAAWLIALEPTNMFFGGLLHKEALMFLAEGLVIYGATQIWVRGRVTGLVAGTIGCLIAVATRPYAGWFLAVGLGITAFHAALRPGWRGTREAIVLVVAVLAVAVAFAPTIWNASSHRNLTNGLQSSQNANTTDNSNLKLERVDFSSRSAIVTNLPKRLFDITFKPYPWQVSNISQRLGLIGTLIVLATFYFLLSAIALRAGRVFSRAGPLLYVGALVFCGYALSAGNAGTAFRYRTHVVVIAIAAVVALRTRTEAATETAPERPDIPAGLPQLA